MTRASCIAGRLGVLVAGALALAGPGPALASRPARTAAIVRAQPRVEIGRGHSVSGGGRGGSVVARRETRPPPRATGTVPSRHDGCVLVRTHQGGRGAAPSRTASRTVAFGGLRAARAADRETDGRGSLAAAIFHDAHAPPSPPTDVAGLLA
jgi:hypothetical protein